MTELIGRYKPGESVPAFCTAQVNAGHFVKVSADKTADGDYSVAHAGAGQWAFGVAQRDSAPASDPSTSYDRRVEVMREGIARVIAGTGGVSAGATVASDATGQAVAAVTGNVILGHALNTVAAGGIAEVALNDSGFVKP